MTNFGRAAFWCGAVLLLAEIMSVSATAADDATIWTGGMDGFAVDWRADGLDATRAGKLVLSFGAVARREWSEVRARGGGRALTLEKTYAVLSDVGPWLSVQEGSFCDCGGAHPSAGQRVWAYDLRKSQPDRGAPADVSRIFPPNAVLAALLDTEAVAGVLKSMGTKPRTLPDLLQALAFQTVQVGDCSYFFDRTLLSSFAFRQMKGDRITVRFGLSAAAQVCRGELTQIEIVLPVPEALRASLRAAADGVGGLLMEKAEGMSAGRTTSFTFSSGAQ